MADTRTEHLNLIKQDPEAVPDYLDDHSNLEILDEEVWKRGKAFNGQPVGEDGGFHIRNVPYAENLETSSSQSSDADFIIRTTGGDASLMDGDAWLTLIKGTMTHTGYVPQSITMTVTPMARPTPPEITATLNKETFIAYVQQPGEYTISYTTSWSESPATYGITVSNDPVNGDSITVVWDGEDDPEMTVYAVPRQAPEGIGAVIDDSVFVAYVQQSGTTTLTYGTSWSADPSLYGITVTGTPIAGDVITVVYVKEVRGTIIQSTPETFVSTGWNLYNHTAGYARVIKYSTEYNFKISGAYTALEFASTPSGTRTTITPVSGAFSIPSDGYIIVTGGNATTTAIWMTWSDWVSGYNWDGSQQGDFAPYSESIIDFGTFMATNFPYGLMQVGTVQDEINFNIGIATSKVLRLAYNDTNLATAKASGRQYEYDENYIYLERETPVTYSIEVDGDYAAFDHGMELFTGTAQAVYAQTLYGQNLKNKLERDVVTISQQTLTSSQQAQVRANIKAVGMSEVISPELKSTFAACFTGSETVAHRYFKVSANASDAPAISNSLWICEQWKSTDLYAWQRAISPNLNMIYIRGLVSGTWADWHSDTLNVGSTSAPITSLDDLPLNAKGSVVFATTLAPSGALRQHSYIKFGLNNNRYLVLANDMYAQKLYVNEDYDGTVKGWQKVKTDGDDFGLALGSASEPITNLDNIPVNTTGHVVLDSTIHPAAITARLNYFCFGTNTYRMLYLMSDASGRIWSNARKVGGTWDGFKEISHISDAYSVSLEQIPANADFNDYITPGAFTVTNASRAASIANCPYTGSGGRLEVIGQNSNTIYMRQMYYPVGTAEFYTRIRANSSGTAWAGWYKTNMTVV